MVEETSEYKHLGIMLNKYMSLIVNIDESCSKLKPTVLSIVNSGINETVFHPVTSFHLYKSIVVPKGLYGAELWNYLSLRQEKILEMANRFCIKFIQVLPKQTRTDIALSLLGSNTIVAEIDKNKLIFMGQLCWLSLRLFINNFLMKGL